MFPKKEGIVEKFETVNSAPSSWDLSLVRCPLLENKDHHIEQITKEHPTGVIFHLSHLIFSLDYKMKYMLPPLNAQTVTDEDVEEVNNGRSEYTLRKRFVKDEGGN